MLNDSPDSATNPPGNKKMYKNPILLPGSYRYRFIAGDQINFCKMEKVQEKSATKIFLKL